MNWKHLITLTLGCLVAATVNAADDWQSLFDGKTLTGWHKVGGPEGAGYRVENGDIVGYTTGGGPNMFLCTDREFGDFELEFDVKFDRPINSGVQIRTQINPPPAEGKRGHPVSGPQIEIDNKQPGVSGYVYGEGTKFRWLVPDADRKPHEHFKMTEWNRFRVQARGPRLQVWINDQLICDLTHADIFKMMPCGVIGLQVHEGGKPDPQGKIRAQVRWRNLRLRELPISQ